MRQNRRTFKTHVSGLVGTTTKKKFFGKIKDRKNKRGLNFGH